MKRLTLLRHAKSSWKNPHLDDFDRPLNKRGQTNAPEMGRRLVQRKMTPDVILSSPARRAAETATLVAAELGYAPEKIDYRTNLYAADLTSLVEVVQSLREESRHVLLIGHNPGLTELALFLAPCPLETLVTCGLVDLELAIKAWGDVARGSGALLGQDYPGKPGPDPLQ